MELVSMIIPIYNIEDYLDRCLESVVHQTYTNLEIILVDDGSTDRCPQMCDEWAKRDSRIQVIHQENGGLSAARNSGLDAASGAYILLLDSDDYIAPVACEHLLRALEDSDADLSICGFLRGSEAHHVFESCKMESPEVIDAETALMRIYSGDESALKYGAACFKLYRRHLFDGVRFPVGKLFEDIYTTHKLIYRSRRIAVLNEQAFYYFQRGSSIMNSKFTLKKLDYLQALVDRVEFFAARGMTDLQEKAYDELLHSLIWEYSRTRDLLNSKPGMDYVMKLFRENYRKGYASKRYPKETRRFLSAFNHNPEWIVLYWKITSRLSGIFKKR